MRPVRSRGSRPIEKSVKKSYKKEQQLKKLINTDSILFGFGLKKRHPDEQYQWVHGIKSCSSSYERGWEATTVCGPPLVYPRYGDITGTWAPARSSGTKEFLELRYLNKWYVTSIDVFETYNPGHIVRISAGIDTMNGIVWYPIWQGEAEKTRFGKSRIFSPPVIPFPYKTDSIRLDMDCTQAKSWVEIDSILFRGIDHFEWTPERHKYYPISFKKAIYTLLCINAQKSYWTREAMYIIILHAAEDWPLQETDIVSSLVNARDKALMETLKGLGFTEDEATTALSVTGNNVELAIELLLASKSEY